MKPAILASFGPYTEPTTLARRGQASVISCIWAAVGLASRAEDWAALRRGTFYEDPAFLLPSSKARAAPREARMTRSFKDSSSAANSEIAGGNLNLRGIPLNGSTTIRT